MVRDTTVGSDHGAPEDAGGSWFGRVPDPAGGLGGSGFGGVTGRPDQDDAPGPGSIEHVTGAQQYPGASPAGGPPDGTTWAQTPQSPGSSAPAAHAPGASAQAPHAPVAYGPGPSTPGAYGPAPYAAPSGIGDPRSWAGEFAAATVVLVALAGLGVLLGVLWQAVTPGAEILMTSDGPVHADVSAETYFADDAWFAVIGGVTGVLSALACWLLVRRHRGPLQLVGTVAGCLVGAVVAWQVGRHIGLAEFQHLLHNAEPDQTFRRPARLSALGVLGVQGFMAAFTYTLLAGWSRWPMLRPPSAQEWQQWRTAWSAANPGHRTGGVPPGEDGGSGAGPVPR